MWTLGPAKAYGGMEIELPVFLTLALLMLTKQMSSSFLVAVNLLLLVENGA
jgi:hypothetical protein